MIAKRSLLSLAAVSLLLLPASPARAAKRKLDLSDLTAEPPIAGRPVEALKWLADGKSFSYVRTRGTGEDAVSEIWVEEAGSGKKRRIVSSADLRIPEETKPGQPTDGVEKQASRPKPIPLDRHSWSPDGQELLLTAENDLWLYRPDNSRLTRLTHGTQEAQLPSFSPDGKRIAFVRGHDLYVLDLASEKETRLTSDGSELVWNGKLDWVYEEELASRSAQAYEWSPDGSRLAYLRLDDGPIAPSPITDFLKVPAAVTWQRYPTAGGNNPQASFQVVKTDGSVLAAVAAGSQAYIAPSFSWTTDSKSVCYRIINRAQTRQETRLLTPGETGRTLFAEEDPYWINDDGLEPPRFLNDGRFLWKSEKTGFAHLYVGRVGETDLTPVTHGDWMVDRVAGVDEKRDLVYFTATEENVRRRPVYRVSLEGKGLLKLTHTRGTHQPELSPDGNYLLDTFSTAGGPPVISLLDSSGRTVRVIDTPDNRLDEFDLASTEEIEVPGEDGSKLEARLTRPSDFDAGRKYPVIVSVYGGPGVQVVRDAWGATSMLDHFFASRGFLVWSLDNHGSRGRGHAFESVIFEEMGKHELADQLAGVRYLKSLPYVDDKRIGIWGWSYGGYMTLYSLTNAPDVWKCGVAGAPVTDWKFYDSVYTERYMRTPQENPKGYEASAPLSNARSLRARLLILHGTADDNVHLQNTLAFVDALVRAGRPYELRLVPGQKHGFRGRAALDFRNAAIWKFFQDNL